MAIVIKATTNAPSGAPLLPGQIGSPYAVSINTLLTGYNNFVFVPDRTGSGRYIYLLDNGGNLQRWDSTTPGTAPVTLLTASALGTALTQMDIALDNSLIYAVTSSNTLISIATSSPYTVTTVQTGLAAGSSVVVNVVTGAASVVTTGASSMDMNQTLWGWDAYHPSGPVVIAVPGSGFFGAVAVDNGEPLVNVYYTGTNFSGTLYRTNVQTGQVTAIGSFPSGSTVNVGGGSPTNRQAFFRQRAYYVIDDAGSLIQFLS